MRRSARVIVLAAAAALAASCGASRIEPRGPTPAPSGPAKRVGAGYYLLGQPRGEDPPLNEKKQPVAPKVVEGFSKVPTTNDWWSSLIWQYEESNPHSKSLYAHPLALRAYANGLGVSYPDEPTVSEREYRFDYREDVRIGVAGLKARATRVHDYSDWTVTAAWDAPNAKLLATFGHGLPFVYVTTSPSATASLTFRNGKVWSRGGSTVAFTVNGHHYAAFAPEGTVWTEAERGLEVALADKNFFSVAVLPDNAAATLETFRRHAYAFVTDTRVSWKYDPQSASVMTTFAVDAEQKQQGGDLAQTPLLALYRHQWRHTKADYLPFKYASPRGEMWTLAANQFNVALPAGGVLPVLPATSGVDRDDLEYYIEDVHRTGDLFPAGLEGKKDTYWAGKSLGKVAVLAYLADQIGRRDLRDQFVQGLKNELEDWFDGNAPSYFWYEPRWATLIGSPSGYFSGSQLNDHHFHYGYFIFGAAAVARFDPEWARRYGPFVELLIRDAANWDRADKRFPFLRHFDAYAGHSWANGPALFDEGNNEESSSEDVNFAVAVLLWGEATGNARVRDLGVYLHATLASTIDQYWFDVDGAVFPKGFEHRTVAMVWGNGGRYDTWWSQEPAYVHAINYLPVTAGSLYLGRDPKYVKANYAELTQRNKGEVKLWRDVAWMYLALADPTRALELFEENPYFTPEFGNSIAHLYHFVRTLGDIGRVDTAVACDIPTAAVFRRDRTRTYAVYNGAPAAKTVTCTDGTRIQVPPRSQKSVRKTVEETASVAQSRP